MYLKNIAARSAQNTGVNSFRGGSPYTIKPRVTASSALLTEPVGRQLPTDSTIQKESHTTTSGNEIKNTKQDQLREEKPVTKIEPVAKQTIVEKTQKPTIAYITRIADRTSAAQKQTQQVQNTTKKHLINERPVETESNRVVQLQPNNNTVVTNTENKSGVSTPDLANNVYQKISIKSNRHENKFPINKSKEQGNPTLLSREFTPPLPPLISVVKTGPDKKNISSEPEKQAVQVKESVQYLKPAESKVPVKTPAAKNDKTHDKLIIGRITVEIIQPAITKIKTPAQAQKVPVTAAVKSSSMQSSKLIFGLGQL